MTRRRRASAAVVGAAAAVLLGLATCGSEPTVLVRIDLSGRIAPTDVDVVRLVLTQGAESIARNAEVEGGSSVVIVELVLGTRLQGRVQLQASAYLGQTLVGTSEVEELDLDAPPASITVTVPL